MSITKLRGCFSSWFAPLIAVVIGVILVVGFLSMNAGGRGGQNTAAAPLNQGKVAFKYENQPIYVSELVKAEQNAKQQKIQSKSQQGQLPELGPTDLLEGYEQAVTTGISTAIVEKLVKREGIKVSEDDIPAFIQSEMQSQLNQARSQAQMNVQFQVMMAQSTYDAAKKKDPNSKETKDAAAKLDEAKKMSPEQYFIKQLGGKTPEQIIEQSQTEVKQRIETEPGFKEQLLRQMALQSLMKKIGQSVDTSDQSLKSSYDKLTFQQIILPSDSKAKADEVYKKIKSGMDFKEAAKQFSTAKDAKGQPIIEGPPIDRLTAMSAKNYAPLTTAKAGDVTPPYEDAAQLILYKLVSVKPDVPKDFDKNKAQRAETMRTQLVNYKLQQIMDAEQKNIATKLTWSDEGWRLIFDLFDLRRGDKFKALQGAENKQKRIAAYKDLLERSKSVVADNPEVPALVRYFAVNQLDVEMPPGPEKEKLKAEQLVIYAQVVDIIPSTDLRLQFVQMLMDENKGDEALTQLNEVVRASFPAGPRTEPLVKRVQELLPKASNLATKGSPKIEEVQKQLKQWHEEDAQRKADEAAAKRADEENRKRNQKEMEQNQKLQQQKPGQQPPKTAPPTPGPANDLAPSAANDLASVPKKNKRPGG